jgi:hypothetical protein
LQSIDNTQLMRCRRGADSAVPIPPPDPRRSPRRHGPTPAGARAESCHYTALASSSSAWPRWPGTRAETVDYTALAISLSAWPNWPGAPAEPVDYTALAISLSAWPSLGGRPACHEITLPFQPGAGARSHDRERCTSESARHELVALGSAKALSKFRRIEREAGGLHS